MSGAPAGATAGVQDVLVALQRLYSDPDPAVKSEANDALQHFQKTQEAWNTANALLLTQDLPLESRLFGAQTFRSKVRGPLTPDYVRSAAAPARGAARAA